MKAKKTTEEKAGGKFMLRNIPPQLKARLQHRAIDEHIALNDLILKAAEFYLESKK
jgi:predicted HicB family RNase H-like nuclease